MTNKPFKDLTREQQIDLLDALRDGELEFMSDFQIWCIGDALRNSVTYRRRPKPLTKPSIDVSHVAAEWKWLAREKDGRSYLHKNQPTIRDGRVWHEGSYVYITAHIFASYTPGTCDWKDSLVRRPE